MNARTPYPSANPINRPIAKIAKSLGMLRVPIRALRCQKAPGTHFKHRQIPALFLDARVQKPPLAHQKGGRRA